MQSISEIKEILGNCSMEELPEQIKQFEEDSRKGVQTALASFRKKYEKHQQELARTGVALHPCPEAQPGSV